MSTNDFVKGECRACAGHLEFPATAAGMTIACPHCGRPTELVASIAPGKTRSRRLVVAVAVALAGGLVPVFLLITHPHPAAVTVPHPASAPPPANSGPSVTTTSPAPPPPEPARPGEILTNNFGISGGTLDKTSGSSLVYVTGMVRNLDDRQRFGVKVEFSLFDVNGRAIGHAKDYQPALDPKGEWRFKAMVMESKAVSARFERISEE